MDRRRLAVAGRTDVTPAISIRNLNHYFGAGELRKQILFDVSADIEPGEIVINTGPPGSGKTTLLTGVCGAGTGKSPSPGITALQA